MKKGTWKKRLAVLAAAAAMMAASVSTAWASVRLGTVEDTYWDDDNFTVAIWEEVEDAYQYEVYLYCDESRVAELKTKKTRIDLESKMKKEGEYTFRVRALAKNKSSDFRDGYWSDYSDGIYIDASFAELIKNGGRIDTQNSGPGATGETGSGVIPNTSVVYTAKWIQNDKGWWYQRSDGTYPANGWFQDPADGRWYYMDANGYMMTGWIDAGGKRYYCAAPSGAMVTGDTTIDGVLYHFDASGALIG